MPYRFPDLDLTSYELTAAIFADFLRQVRRNRLPPRC